MFSVLSLLIRRLAFFIKDLDLLYLAARLGSVCCLLEKESLFREIVENINSRFTIN